MSDNENSNETLLTFPCEYTIKVIGESSPHFEGEVVRIIREHIPTLGEAAIRQKKSKQKNYVALTAIIWVEDKPTLDALYEALSGSPHTIFVL